MKILIIRLSAMGDVAMCAPVLKTISEQYPEHEYFFLTRKAFKPFFRPINNLNLVHPDLNGKHKGLKGLFILFKKLKKEIDPDLIIDLHDVIRTKYISFLFRISGAGSYKIDKGRKEKRKLVAKNNKKRHQLKLTVERYFDTFRKAGLNSETLESALFTAEKQKDESKRKRIGIAPFAKHLQKQYPLELMEEVIEILDSKKHIIYLFGGGKKEKAYAEKLENKYGTVNSMIGKMTMDEEINMIAGLDLMLTMDSGNMHIAALTGIKIVSVWGATHPYAGFAPFTSKERSFMIQNEDLDCRPCSVFGSKACYKNSLECLQTIHPDKIVEVCEKALKANT